MTSCSDKRHGPMASQGTPESTIVPHTSGDPLHPSGRCRLIPNGMEGVPMTRAKVSGRMTLGIACLATLLVRGGAGAAPGSLDTSFGSGGKVTTSIGAGDDGHDVVIYDGRRLVDVGGS